MPMLMDAGGGRAGQMRAAIGPSENQAKVLRSRGRRESRLFSRRPAWSRQRFSQPICRSVLTAPPGQLQRGARIDARSNFVSVSVVVSALHRTS